MHAFDVILLIGAVCGFTMVLGGIVLLYKGAISLTSMSDKEALTVEFKKELRISTQYPALAIFVIGLLFVGVSVWAGKVENRKIVVEGEAIDVTEPVVVLVRVPTWNSGFRHQGKFVETFDPAIETIQVEIAAPGFEANKKTYRLSDLKNGEVKVGEVRLKQVLKLDKISSSPPAADPQAPPPGSAQFGSAQ